jgi:hypothetical protein
MLPAVGGHQAVLVVRSDAQPLRQFVCLCEPTLANALVVDG